MVGIHLVVIVHVERLCLKIYHLIFAIISCNFLTSHRVNFEVKKKTGNDRFKRRQDLKQINLAKQMRKYLNSEFVFIFKRIIRKWVVKN